VGHGEKWAILGHIHTACCGRLLIRVAPDGTAVTKCADCGEEVAGSHERMCWCGIPPIAARSKFRCVPNQNRTAEMPAEFVAIEVTP
jgi:hypothetical protein